MNWFSFSILSVIALATAELMQQYLLDKYDQFDEITSAVLTTLVQSVFTVPIILFSPIRKEFWAVFSASNLPFFILVALVSSLGTINYLKGLRVKNISISGVIFSFSIVVSTTLGILFLNETLYFSKILGILLILIAIFSLCIENLQLEKNHLYALVGGLLFGIVYTIDKQIVQSVPPMIYVFWSFMAVSVTVFAFKTKEVIVSVKKSKIVDVWPVAASGAGYFLYNLSTFLAYERGGEVGRIDAINNSQVFLIILFEYFILKQKGGLGRKILGSTIAFTGVFILGIL